MTVCPLCEHSQAAGAECEVCGRALDAPEGGDAASPALEGLEPTLRPAVDAAEPEPLQGLEPTRLAPGGPAPAGPAPDPLELEPSRAEQVQVDVEPVPDLEPTATGIPGDAPTPVPIVTICRYCRTPAAPGERRCGRCGMRLPAASAAGSVEPGGAPAEARICSCGARVTGASCPACGARNP